MTLTPAHLLELLQKTLAYDGSIIALHEPQFKAKEWEYVKECLDTGWVSSVGKFVDQFEKDLATYTGAKYAIATVNGTAALHMCYRLAGVCAGDEVLVPTLTFVGTINPIAYCNAIPHFIDCESEHLGLNVNLLDAYLAEISKMQGNFCINRLTNRPIRALCVMHTLGHPVDLDGIAALCQKYKIILIEDAAEALGSYYKNTHVGHRGLLGALSFNGNKIITTGGGGAILTNHAEIARRAKHLTTTAKRSHLWLFDHDEVGFNYRLPNINAALGCAQLECLPDALVAKRALYKKYEAAFAQVDGVKLLKEPSYAKSNFWLNALLLDQPLEDLRDNYLQGLTSNGVMVRPLWNLQHTLSMYSHCPRMPLPVAEAVIKRLIKLPSSPKLMRAS